jgi:hypothetical protein
VTGDVPKQGDIYRNAADMLPQICVDEEWINIVDAIAELSRLRRQVGGRGDAHLRINDAVDLDSLRRRWSTVGPMGEERSDADYTDAGCRILLRLAWGDIDVLLRLAKTVRRRHHVRWVVTPPADGQGPDERRAVCNADGWEWPCPDAALFSPDLSD